MKSNGDGESSTPALQADSTEAKTLETTQEFGHPHLIRAIAVYQCQKRHYFIFPWADYGNLKEYWITWDGLERVPWALKQIEGLCDALEKFHAKNWRHGDLKPENILCFAGEHNSASMEDAECVLVIGDVGLAKNHVQHTQFRQGITKTMTGTFMYGPPEETGEPRSRLYDTWSMGAIILEMLMCMLYGHKKVNELTSSIQKYYVDDTSNFISTKKVHDSVLGWIEYMCKKDKRCGSDDKPTVIRRLLHLVRDRLLVVKIPKNMGQLQRVNTWENEEPTSQVQIPTVIVDEKEAVQQYPHVAVQADDDNHAVVRAGSKELHEAILQIKKEYGDGNGELPIYHKVQGSFPGPTLNAHARETTLGVHTTTAQASRQLSPQDNAKVRYPEVVKYATLMDIQVVRNRP